jgi:hypothetical protein
VGISQNQENSGGRLYADFAESIGEAREGAGGTVMAQITINIPDDMLDAISHHLEHTWRYRNRTQLILGLLADWLEEQEAGEEEDEDDE